MYNESTLLPSIENPASNTSNRRKILLGWSRFEVFDRIICKAVGNLVSNGQITYNDGVRSVKALMYENQMRLFNLKGEFNE